MKIGIVGDVHYCQYSSIIRGRGNKYSKRLENCIASINWAEELFTNQKCDQVFYLGDFFDKPDLNAEEISSLKEISWNTLPHSFIVGNHELGNNNLSFNSANALNFKIYTEATKIEYDNNLEICLLPYILETNRQPLIDYFDLVPKDKKRLILSHNDISGIQMGQFISKIGFTIEEIERCSTKFINGHLHNGEQITSKIINIGNLTGQNFSENAFQYDHCVFILDTDTFSIDAFENPVAFNFYKLDALNNKINFNKLKNNAIITLKCRDKDLEAYKNTIINSTNISDSRVVVDFSLNKSSRMSPGDNFQTLAVDHLAAFKEFILDALGDNKIVMEELSEVFNE